MSDENVTPFPAPVEEEKPKQFKTTFTVSHNAVLEPVETVVEGYCMITRDCFAVQNEYGIPLLIVPVNRLIAVTTVIEEIVEDADGARTVH